MNYPILAPIYKTSVLHFLDQQIDHYISSQAITFRIKTYRWAQCLVLLQPY